MSNYRLRKQNEKITVDPPEESEESLVDDWDDDPDYDPKNNKKPDSQICSMYVKMTMNPMSLLLMTIIRQVHLPQQKEKEDLTLYKKKKDSMPVPVWTDVPEINSEQPFTAQLEAGVDYILGSPIDYFKDLFDSNILDVIVAERNAFRIQKYSNKPFNISKPVLEQYIATCVYMIIYGLPRSRMYWNNHTRVEKIANVM